MLQPIIAFNQERPARLLTDYLCSQGIEARYQQNETEHPHAVLVIKQEQLPNAKVILEEFLKNPADGKYQLAAWQTGNRVSTLAEDKGRFQYDPRLFDIRRIPFTLLVMALCMVAYIATAALGLNTFAASLIIRPLDELIVSQEWWRLIGPVFRHFSSVHLIFNLLAWWIFASKIEREMGRTMLLLLFLLTAVLSNIGQLLVSGPYFGGLSGVVYGVIGFVWWIGWLRPDWQISVPKPFVGLMLLWILLGYMDVLWVSMANTAHTVGLMAGCGFAWLIVQLRSRPSNPDKDTW